MVENPRGWCNFKYIPSNTKYKNSKSKYDYHKISTGAIPMPKNYVGNQVHMIGGNYYTRGEKMKTVVL